MKEKAPESSRLRKGREAHSSTFSHYCRGEDLAKVAYVKGIVSIPETTATVVDPLLDEQKRCGLFLVSPWGGHARPSPPATPDPRRNLFATDRIGTQSAGGP